LGQDRKYFHYIANQVMSIIPKTGIKGLFENWQSDLLASISVALVALPLALGIAIASNVPPMAGILSAVIGGVVTTFFRGSHVAINGPAAGLIAVILGSLVALDDGSGQALNYVFAAIVVSGGIQVLLGLLKLGRFADLFHSTVIHGILAAIGVIIFAKQIHVTLGLKSNTTNVIETFVDVVHQVPNINPFVAVISFVGLLLLIFHSKISYKFFHFLPAPMWVLFLSIPFVYYFNFFSEHGMIFMGRSYDVGPSLLINIPENLLDAIGHPNFSMIGTGAFWLSVLSITLIASIESLAGSKAVDKLDPYRRKTNLNKDLIGIGLSTMVSGMLGGLPIITVIVRSTVNVQNHGKTKWSNLYHGILLLLFVFLLAPVIQKVPLAALAILLVYTGYKLASPKVFKHVYHQGFEQLLFFTGTLVITLFTDLLIGIFGGLLLVLLTHIVLSNVEIKDFFRLLFQSGSEIKKKASGDIEVRIKGIANFLSTLNVNNLLDQVEAGSKVNVNLEEARLVDFSIMELLYDFKRTHEVSGGELEISGLENHISYSSHKLALRISKSIDPVLSSRRKKLQEMADVEGYNFELEPKEDIEHLETFYQTLRFKIK
jgi:MFS superfamily sulfate permease-like transporter